jgi:hypothetical protein
MSSKARFGWCALAAALLGACGNYSNEDLDFQLALPEQSDIQVQTKLSTIRVDSAEYYRVTRNAIATFNEMVRTLTALVDLVRGTTPTTRNGNMRIWGPWPVDKYPTWELRMVMQRSTVSTSLLRMDYSLELRPRGASDSAWVPFLTGRYTSAGSARNGEGEIHLLASDARDAGYPVNDDPGLVELDHLDVTYSTASYPTTVAMAIVNLTTAKTRSGQYAYLQNQDGSGVMTFDWQGITDTGANASATMQAEWLGSGAGRADLIYDPAGLRFTLGTDCWGVDTVATYHFRVRDDVTGQPIQEGPPASCLF